MPHALRILVPAVTVALALATLATAAQANPAGVSQSLPPTMQSQPLAASPFDLAGARRASLEDAGDLAATHTPLLQTAQLVGGGPR